MDEESDYGLSIILMKIRRVKWTTTDKTIATVDNGTIHANKAGKSDYYCND